MINRKIGWDLNPGPSEGQTDTLTTELLDLCGKGVQVLMSLVVRVLEGPGFESQLDPDFFQLIPMLCILLEASLFSGHAKL